MVASDGCSVSVCPSRSTVTVTGVPAGCARMAAPSWFQVCTGLPASVMILSPACRPDLTAGDAGSDLTQVVAVMLFGTHGSMDPTVADELFVAWPMPAARMNSSTKASTKCMNEPAASTIIRCQPGWRRNDRGSSAGSTSSSRGHPDDLDEAAGRHRLDAVLGLTADR